MSEKGEAVRRYLDAVTSGTDDAREALAAVLADDVTLSSPLGTSTGREALLESVGRVQPMLAAATWSDPVVDGDLATVSATLPPGSVLGTAALTFQFDGAGKIAGLQQALTPGAPPPPTRIALDGAIADAVNGALDNGTPIIAAYVSRDGQPQLSLRGTTQVYSDDQLALWIRNPEGGLIGVLPENARLTFFYRDPATRTFLQIQGRGRVDDDPHVRDVVFDNSPEREQAIDPERRGAAVIVDVDRVQGRLPDGAINMERRVLTTTADVVVVGGGLVGAACAYELARDGHTVAMVDRRDVGRATDAGAGILSPETYGGSVPSFLDLVDLAGEHYRTLVPALADIGAPDPRYDVCGTLRVGFREGDDDAFAANAELALARHPGVLAHVTVDEARVMYPPLGPIRHALFNSRGARVDGRSMVAALEFAARSLGVDWRTESAKLVVDGHDVTVETPTATISAGAVVVAGGAWTTELASAFGMRTGVRPVRGQIVHLHLDADTGSWPVLQPIFSHYVVPFRDGRLALGATVEDVGFEVRPTASGIAQLFSEGLRLSPGLADATFLEVRVGLRPVSDDDLPVIGALSGAENVYVASGHGANGLLLGPVTGRVVAGLVSAQPPAIDLADFSPARFARV